ncbi:MAG: PfkB family carbohydrate kinase [Verrucomicrobiota bacterium]
MPESAGGVDIVGIGMSILDSIQVVDRFPVGSGVTEASASILMGGGPVATALCAASRLGAQTMMMDRIGSDWIGERILKSFADYGVETHEVIVEESRESSLATILVRESDGERHIIFRQGTAATFKEADLALGLLDQCSILHLNGRHWSASLEAAKRVRARGGNVSFDGGAHRYQSQWLELFPHVDVLIVAGEFAEQCSGSKEVEEQLHHLSQWGAAIVGITLGDAGSWFRPRDGGIFHQPAISIERVVDTTGCGDVFHGAFLFAMTRGREWRECARVASAAAACNAGTLGGRGHLPTWSEVEVLLEDSN